MMQNKKNMIQYTYMKEKILILAYPGSGKTYLADNYNNVSDLEFQHYRWNYGEYKSLPLEQLKGRKDIRTNNPEWPNNFFEILDNEIEKRKLVLVPMATSLFEHAKYLQENKQVKIIFAIPTKRCFEDILEMYKKRGNNQKFIEDRKKDYLKFYDIVEKTEFDKLYINKNEHLSDAVAKQGIALEEGKGFKNYF